MTYRILILRRARKEFGALPEDVRARISGAILSLASEPRPSGCEKLASRDGWRLRVGNYRVIYETDDPARTVTVMHVGHRRDVYRLKP